MADKYLHPDKDLAIKYVIVAFALYIIDYLIPFTGLVSVILMLLGVKVFIHDENNHFKTAYKSVKKLTVFYVLMVLASFVPELGIFIIPTKTAVRFVSMGITTIYYIYTTHYFTEGVMLDAKKAKINFVKLGLNTPWILLGIIMVVRFLCAVKLKQPIPGIATAIAFILCCYYCITLYHAYQKIYAPEKTDK